MLLLLTISHILNVNRATTVHLLLGLFYIQAPKITQHFTFYNYLDNPDYIYNWSWNNMHAFTKIRTYIIIFQEGLVK